MSLTQQVNPRNASRTMPLKSLAFRHLEAFRAIMRTGTVTGAGAMLGVSQPAVSRLLSQTERLAGFPLFERVRGRLVPTATAQALHEETERIFTGIEEVSALAARLRTAATSIERTPHLLRFVADGVRFSVFPGGRTLLFGVRDPLRARALYDRWIGAS